LFQFFYKLGNRRALLTDADIDAVQVLFLVLRGVDVFLVDDRVDSDSRFTGLAVADDQFALAASDGNKRINSFQAPLHRLMTRFTGHNSGRFQLDAAGLLGFQRTLAVDRVTKTVNNAAQQFFTNRHFHDLARTLDDVAFLDVAVVAE